jgi:DNA modification methylase
VDVRIPDRLLTEEEEIELNLRLNKNTGQWDLDALANMDEELLMLVGFEPAELDNIFELSFGKTGKDDAPDLAEETTTKPGDLFQLGNHRLMCGDARDLQQLRSLLSVDGQPLQADLVFTDPPYNVNYAGKGENTSEGIENDNIDPVDFRQLIERSFANLFELMREGAVYYICSGWSCYPVFDAELINQGFQRAGVIIWVKDNASYGWNDFRYKHEWIVVGKRKEKRIKAASFLYGWKKGGHFFRSTRDEYDVWQVPREHSADYKHPTQKPVWLVEKALANSSERGGVILDPFSGSGSTLIACERLKRRAFCMDSDPKYVDVIIKRWEAFTGLKALQLNEIAQEVGI